MEERKLTKEDIDKVRNIEGFPIGSDEDIIALSRPPYYTACPNPFIADFIKEHGTPYDEATDDYHREPFAADVSEGKNDPIYMAHGYHTKVPYKAIMRYILHYTKPGDVVFDGFCGTGMTGVASLMCDCPDIGLKYTLEQDMKGIVWGKRYTILNDLSPAATFISSNYNAPNDVIKAQEEAQKILETCEKQYGWMYGTRHIDANGRLILDFNSNPIIGTINYTVWSDVFVCPTCSKELVFWDVAIDHDAGSVRDVFSCPHCGSNIKKNDCSHSCTTQYDDILCQTTTMAKQIPVLINYSVGKKRFTKRPDDYDLQTIEKINTMQPPYAIPHNRTPDGIESRRNDITGITNAHQFYTRRNLFAVSAYCYYARENSLAMFAFTASNTNVSKLYRYRSNGKGGNLSGTLYIPSTPQENNFFQIVRRKIADIQSAFSSARVSCSSIIGTGSTTKLNTIPDNSVDYMFTDPPFGGNLNYSELSFLWESWLKVYTNNILEAVMNRIQGKGLLEYQQLMERCFCEYYRILKPGRWITVEFHNSQNAVWNAISEALLRAGFIIADVRTLDKKQSSFKQIMTATAVKQDLVITAYKPKESFIRQFTERAGDSEMAWEFARQHLNNVPIAPDGDNDGKIDIVAERFDYLLFDRMVAFHIMNGIPVPMDAHTFYAGLRERFIQRDGMFFLADQINEYDERRAKMELQDQQLSLFISDEKSAISWLGVQLTKERQSYSDIQPKYLQELHQAKFELLPELLDMLKENFLQDDDGKWYVPNLSDKADLEKLRRKRLLKDFFDIYAKGTGRIKNARTEAIRVGFDECWKERNYSLIVKVGDRLPETVLQEDPALLMYYDNAASRM